MMPYDPRQLYRVQKVPIDSWKLDGLEPGMGPGNPIQPSQAVVGETIEKAVPARQVNMLDARGQMFQCGVYALAGEVMRKRDLQFLEWETFDGLEKHEVGGGLKHATDQV
jgi:hypothetical protein